MKKIDLHIHTVASPIKDSPFDFDINKLISYVKTESLDAIAITNHNLFDEEQFNEIINRFKDDMLDTKIFPGVEIDLENGHLLYITELEKVGDLKKSCELLYKEILKETDSITFNQFIELFPNYSDALLIPHGEGKRPVLQKGVVEKFGEQISTVEVQNQKKFMLLKKSADTRTPMLFSDVRVTDQLDVFPKRCTFVDIGDLNISALKATLTDKSKVHLSDNIDREEVFEVDDVGTKASVGLNVVLGARATGKTFLMNKIARTFPNTKYIRQFQLMSAEETSDETFKSNKNQWFNNESVKYLRDYSNIVSFIGSINRSDDEVELNNFVESLLGNALDLELNDEFSKCKLFNADKLQIVNSKRLKDLINAISLLLDPGDEHKKVISEYIDLEKMKHLLKVLISDYENSLGIIFVVDETNKVIDEVREGLKQKTSVTQITDFDEIKFLSNELRTILFDSYTLKLREKGEFTNYDMHGFRVIAECIQGETVSAAVLKEINDNRGNFSSLKSVYKTPYKYLKELQKNHLVRPDNIANLLVPTRVRVLNGNGKDVSGGEKSEFNLMNALNDAYLHDMLIVDEPESSFDNVFLNKNVNAILKDISQTMPVFVVTHNNSIGASIKPDYLMYTDFEFDAEGNLQYNVFTGKPTSQYLRSPDGRQMDNYVIQMKSLEGGHSEYKQREIMYKGIGKI